MRLWNSTRARARLYNRTPSAHFAHTRPYNISFLLFPRARVTIHNVDYDIITSLKTFRPNIQYAVYCSLLLFRLATRIFFFSSFLSSFNFFILFIIVSTRSALRDARRFRRVTHRAVFIKTNSACRKEILRKYNLKKKNLNFRRRRRRRRAHKINRRLAANFKTYVTYLGDSRVQIVQRINR